MFYQSSFLAATIINVCLVRIGGVNRNGDKTRQFCLVLTQFPICNCSASNILKITENLEIGNWVEKRQNCLVLSPILFRPPTRTRQDKTVLTCPCRRCCELGITTAPEVSIPFYSIFTGRAQLASSETQSGKKNQQMHFFITFSAQSNHSLFLV